MKGEEHLGSVTILMWFMDYPTLGQTADWIKYIINQVLSGDFYTF